jgi:hypothetical protein
MQANTKLSKKEKSDHTAATRVLPRGKQDALPAVHSQLERNWW